MFSNYNRRPLRGEDSINSFDDDDNNNIPTKEDPYLPYLPIIYFVVYF